MNEKTTTIQVSHSVWREIKNRKDLGVSSDDVLRKALGLEIKEDE